MKLIYNGNVRRSAETKCSKLECFMFVAYTYTAKTKIVFYTEYLFVNKHAVPVFIWDRRTANSAIYKTNVKERVEGVFIYLLFILENGNLGK